MGNGGRSSGVLGAVLGPVLWPVLGGMFGCVLGLSDARADQLTGYDLSAVTALAQGAINGQNVETPVPGFDLRILKDGVVIYHRAFGAWSIDRLANADSSTKTIAGAVIMALVETNQNQTVGRFALDTRLSDYFAGLPTDLGSVTIRQAFSHTSGIGPTTLGEQVLFNQAISSQTLTLQQAALQMLTVNLAYPPGTAFWYGGNSMHIAGAVAERASGQTWNGLYQTRIAQPLGLTRTVFRLTTPSNPRIAGGCDSTASEFGRFMEMLRRGGLHRLDTGVDVRVLQQASVDALFTRQSPDPVTLVGSPLEGVTDYGVGVWLDQRDAQGRLLGAIAAGARGFASWVDFDDGVVGVLATDTTSGSNLQNLYNLLRSATEAAVRSPISCPADFNQSGGLSVQDVFDFLTAYFANDPAADINAGGSVSVQDVFDFLERYFGGC